MRRGSNIARLAADGPPAAADGVRVDAGTLRTLFLDLVARPPLGAERERFSGAALEQVTRALVPSREFWEQWLESQLYYFLLIENFRPASDGVRALPEELARGSLDVRSAIHRVALCPSFDRRNPGADTFVTVVMEQLLGIEVQRNTRELEIGKRVYDGRPGTFLGRRGATQSDVVRIAIEDERFFEHFVERERARLKLAPLEPRAVAEHARELESDPFGYAELVVRWVLSGAWTERAERAAAMPNRLFVRALFVDLFDRLPDQDEARGLRGALDGLGDAAPLRSALARILLDTGDAPIAGRAALDEPAEWVRELFQRFLGRAPTERERTAFAAALADPECEPATAVFAILSHPDYATY